MPNVSNTEIAHFNIYDPKNWENFDNTSKNIIFRLIIESACLF